MLLFLFILVSAKSFIRKTDLVARFVIMLAQSFFFCMQCLNCPVFAYAAQKVQLDRR